MDSLEQQNFSENKKKNLFSNKKNIILGIIILILIIGFIWFLLQPKTIAYGYIHQKNGLPIEGVKVFSGGATTYSDSSGKYELFLEPKKRHLINFEKEGFVPIHKVIPKDNESKIYFKILMPEMEPFKKFDQNKRGRTRAEFYNSEMVFDENSFGVRDGNNIIYPEQIQISMTYLDPSNPKDIEAFPGEFVADFNDSTYGLESFGFAKILVQDKDGKDLEIIDKNVEIKIKVSQNGDAPKELPLWYYDTKQGEWILKGTAKLTGSGKNKYYVGDIDIIGSWWNCDYPFERSFVDIVFNKKFTESKWRILVDVAGIFFEPIDWGNNLWVIFNPYTDKSEKILAGIAMLPLINKATAGAIKNAILKSPLTKKVAPLINNTILKSMEKKALKKAINHGGRAFGDKLILVPKGKTGIYEAHLLGSIGDYTKVKTEMASATSFFDNVKGIYGETPSNIASRFFKQIQDYAGIPKSATNITSITASSAQKTGYFLGELSRVYPAGNSWSRYSMLIDPSAADILNKITRNNAIKFKIGDKINQSLLPYLRISERYDKPKNQTEKFSEISEKPPIFYFSSEEDELKASYGGQIIFDDEELLFEEGKIKKIKTKDFEENYYYGKDGELTKKEGKDYILEYNYSEDFLSLEKKLKSKINGETITQNISYLPEEKKLILKSPEIGESVEAFFDDNNNLVLAKLIFKDSNVEYTSQKNQTKIIINNPTLGKTTIEESVSYYGGESYSITYYYELISREKYKKKTYEKYDKNQNLITIKETHSEILFNGEEKKIFDLKIDNTYLNNFLENSNITIVDENKKTTTEKIIFNKMKDFSEMGYPIYFPNTKIENEYSSILTDSFGRIKSFGYSKDLFKDLNLALLKTTAEIKYLDNGEFEKIISSNNEEAKYKTNDPLIFEPLEKIDSKNKQQEINFLNQLGLSGVNFEARLDGLNYNYTNQAYFTPNTEKVSLICRGEALSKIKIMLQDTCLHQEDFNSEYFGQKKEIVIGDLPLAGLETEINVSNEYSKNLNGFLVFESGKIRSISPVELHSGKNNILKPIKSNTINSVYFQNFDFSSEKINLSPINRLKIGKATLDIPYSCNEEKIAIIVFDVSGSMDGKSAISPNISKETLQEQALKDLLDSFSSNTRYVLMPFGRDSLIGVRKEDKISWERLDIKSLIGKEFIFRVEDNDLVKESFGYYPSDGTNIERALLGSLDVAKNFSSTEKRIILLTDGQSDVNFLKISQALGEKTTISSVGVFGEGDNQDFESEILKEISSLGKGDYHEVSDYESFYLTMESTTKKC